MERKKVLYAEQLLLLHLVFPATPCEADEAGLRVSVCVLYFTTPHSFPVRSPCLHPWSRSPPRHIYACVARTSVSADIRSRDTYGTYAGGSTLCGCQPTELTNCLLPVAAPCYAMVRCIGDAAVGNDLGEKHCLTGVYYKSSRYTCPLAALFTSRFMSCSRCLYWLSSNSVVTYRAAPADHPPQPPHIQQAPPYHARTEKKRWEKLIPLLRH